MACDVHAALAGVGDQAEQARHGGLAWLSGDEQQRFASFTAPRRREQFLAGRWLARALLVQVHGGDALLDWPLSAAVGAPPSVLRGGAPCIAISHSGDWVACAIAAAPVGLDVETLAPRRDHAALAAAICTLREQERLLALSAARRPIELLLAWSLKEAWLKRRGEGLDLLRMAGLHTGPAALDEAQPAQEIGRAHV